MAIFENQISHGPWGANFAGARSSQTGACLFVSYWIQFNSGQIWNQDGRCPFEEWLNSLRDVAGRAIIRKRLNRVRVGNLGHTRSLGDGVWELKVDFGPGYRVYFGEDGPRLVVLLVGGDKGSQERDIMKAKEYWNDYQS